MANTNVRVLESLIQTIETVSSERDLQSFFVNDREAFSRKSKVSFSTVTYLILNMLKKSLHVELKLFFEKINLATDRQFTKGAFSQRRHQISSRWFKYLLEYFAVLFYEISDDVKLWKKLKLIAIDGSSAILINGDDSNKVYKGAKNKYGTYPLCRFMKMYDVLNDITLRVQMMNMNDSERKCAYEWVDKLPDDSLTLYDRGFPSFTLFFLMQSCESPKQFIARCKLDFSNSIKEFVASSNTTRKIKFFADDRARALLKSYGYKVDKKTYVEIRAEKIKLPGGSIEVLLTSILEKKELSNDEMKMLYGKRWGIETAIGTQKNLLQLENFSSHLINGIEQDFYATFLAGNIHSMICKQAQAELDKKIKKSKYKYQVNRSASLNSFKANAIKIFYAKKLKKLLHLMEKDFMKFTEPIRPNRKIKRIKVSKRRYGKHQTHKNYRNNL